MYVDTRVGRSRLDDKKKKKSSDFMGNARADDLSVTYVYIAAGVALPPPRARTERRRG